MATVDIETPVSAEAQTLQELVDRLGGIPLSRILARPAPGLATEEDLLRVNESKRRLCELVDGTLVEKAMGIRKSLLAVALAGLLRQFIKPRKLGIVTGADGTIKLFPGLVRIPDVAYISWDRIPGRSVPREAMAILAPDLAVEVLRSSNTKPEMERKRREYFDAGALEVWLIDPETRTAAVYRRNQEVPREYDCSQTIEETDVLPGSRLVLADLFAELDERG